MRCAIDFDESKTLLEQSVNAWGEMQSLEEIPSYREEDIESVENKEFFRGYKMALDNVCNDLTNLVEDCELTEAMSEKLQTYMAGDLCLLLFSILEGEME